jgi:cytochrome c oxidase subunit 1
MVLAALLALVGVLLGADITYSASVPLAKQYSASGFIYLSFSVLAVGMLVVAIDFVMTIIQAVPHKMDLSSWALFFRAIPISTFAAIAGMFIAIPGLIAALNTFIPAFLWTLNMIQLDPITYLMNWDVAFHLYHYIPALTLVGAAYLLVEATSDAHSIYPKQLAKAFFLLYPFFVAPTFLYHLLVNPNIPENIKFIGTILSLLVGTPTLLHMFIIVGMLEARLRESYNRFWGWILYLPWRNPAFSSMFMGMVTLFVGGLLAYLLLQEQLAPYLHNTFAVPAYIHSIAAGGANLMYMGALYYGVPLLTQRRLVWMGAARIQPYLMGAALLIMTIFGAGAGLAGVPRRFAQLGEDAPASWSAWLNLSLGIGGTLSLIAVVLFLAIVLMTALKGVRAGSFQEVVSGMGPLQIARQFEVRRTIVALIPVALFIVGISLLTILTFAFIKEHSFYGG